MNIFLMYLLKIKKKIFLNKNNQEEYSWNCLDFNEENNLIDSFFNKKI